MKNFLSLFEDLFVAIAFAEAGEYAQLINTTELCRRFPCSTAS